MKMRGNDAAVQVLRLAVNAVILFLALIAAAVVILTVCGIRPYVVLTGSMAPQIPVGSVCLVNQRCGTEGIQSGDVITFCDHGGAVVTHRAVRIQDGCIYTMGDANQVEDETAVTAENFIGKCVLSIPKIGFIVRFIRSPLGNVTAAAFITLLILADRILDRLKPRRSS